MTERAERRLDFGRKLLIVTAAICVAVSSALGQIDAAPSGSAAQTDNTAAKLPAYDVASIKLNKSSRSDFDINTDIDRYSAANIPLKQLLEDAYDIKQDLITGVPEPVASARFDIQAKILEANSDVLKKLSWPQRRAMLLPILSDRFQLQAHTETKILPVYELVVARGGPKLQKSPSDSKQGSGGSLNNGKRVTLTSHNCSMVCFANMLEGQVHRTVIDKTSLVGNYDFALTWSRDDGSDTQTDSAPSIFTALPEQLGLKLQPAKGPAVTLVVDHVEMPSEN